MAFHDSYVFHKLPPIPGGLVRHLVRGQRPEILPEMIGRRELESLPCPSRACSIQKQDRPAGRLPQQGSAVVVSAASASPAAIYGESPRLERLRRLHRLFGEIDVLRRARPAACSSLRSCRARTIPRCRRHLRTRDRDVTEALARGPCVERSFTRKSPGRRARHHHGHHSDRRRLHHRTACPGRDH